MKKEIYKELEELDSVLTKYKKDDIYNVSDSYFEEMQKSVLSNLNKKEKAPKVVSFRINKWMMGIAASLLILVAAIFAVNRNSDTSDQLASSDIIEYLSVYVDDFDESDFANYLTEEDFSTSAETNINTDDIESYLENNIDDISEEDLQQLF